MATDLREPQRGAGALVRGHRHRSEAEHEVGEDRPEARAHDLHDDVRQRVPLGQTAEPRVDACHHGVEVRAGDRPEGGDQDEQHCPGGQCVLQQLQADVSGRQGRRGDPGPDHGGHQQQRAEALGEQPAAERQRRHAVGAASAASISAMRPSIRRPDLVPDRAHGVDALPGRVLEHPVEVGLAREERARVAAAHGDDVVRSLHRLGGEDLGRLGRDVDALLEQRLHHGRVDGVGGRGTRRTHLDAVACQMASGRRRPSANGRRCARTRTGRKACRSRGSSLVCTGRSGVVGHGRGQ